LWPEAVKPARGFLAVALGPQRPDATNRVLGALATRPGGASEVDVRTRTLRRIESITAAVSWTGWNSLASAWPETRKRISKNSESGAPPTIMAR
jgi:hypothetical protein